MIRVIASKKKSNSLLEQMEILSHVRTALMNDKVAKQICKDKGMGEWFLKSVPISFDKLKPTAKTINGKIVLNPKLMKKPFNILMRYVIHELTHAIQHVDDFGEKEDDKSQDYLDREDEVEAFQYQVEYDVGERGLEKVEEYVEGLLDFHDIPAVKQNDKKEELLDRA